MKLSLLEQRDGGFLPGYLSVCPPGAAEGTGVGLRTGFRPSPPVAAQDSRRPISLPAAGSLFPSYSGSLSPQEYQSKTVRRDIISCSGKTASTFLSVVVGRITMHFEASRNSIVPAICSFRYFISHVFIHG